jgi:hypothetical protein
MDGWMRAVQTNEQQMEETEPRVDAERPPKKPRGQAMHVLPEVAQVAIVDDETESLIAHNLSILNERRT